MFKKYEGERKKQILVFLGSVGLIFGALYFWNRVTGGEKVSQPQVPEVKITETERIERAYEEGYEVRAREIEKRLGELMKEIRSLKEENLRLRKELREKEAERRSSVSEPPPPPSPSGEGRGFLPPPPPPPQKLPEDPDQVQKQTIQELKGLIGIIKSEEGKKPPVPEKKEKKEKRSGFVIPKGSFVRAVLLSGVDAPAGGKAMGNPHPVLLRITDRAILPNRWKADIKECFVIGSAYGDLSSERAYIRLESLSCVKESGKAVEAQVKGFVAGEDGKVGLRGRVVTRQGQILARTLIAGFLEGVAKAFRYSSTNLIISPQGAVSAINPDQVAQVGIASGAAEAARKLADFYMKLANQMFPVIEVNAGRRVDVVFLSEVRL